MKNKKKAFAIGAHPDDIEFMMAGTLCLLKQKGYEVHYLNLASGNLGSLEYDSETTRAIRLKEARRSASILGAQFHPPICDDLEIFYEKDTLLKLAAIIRTVNPQVVLTHSPIDYAEDHTNTCRLVVSAVFAKIASNLTTNPPVPPSTGSCTIYHSLPHTLRDQLRRKITAGAYVNTSSVFHTKLKALKSHTSQQNWLESSQKMDSYLQEMERVSLEVGTYSKLFKHAEGWRRHLHHGFGEADEDPLMELGSNYIISQEYEDNLISVPSL